MADWNIPGISDNYLDVLDDLKDRDTDASTMAESPSNPPNLYKRWNSTLNKFQYWNSAGAAWTDMVLSIAGGGTGASTASGARTALGLGSMATQDDSAVNITGGSISGINLDAGVITSGIVALARGGTGASLALGAIGTVLMSNGTAVAFQSGVNIANLSASNLTTGTVPDARFPATLPAVSGVNLTALNASNLGSGTVPDARFPATLPAISGANLTNLNASNLATGTVATARLGSGSATSSTFLRGDGTWAVPGGVGVPSGLIAIFDASCPSGWTRVSAFDSKFLRGSATYGSTGGSDTHSHRIRHDTDSTNIDHTHTFSGTTGGPSNASVVASGIGELAPDNTHTHTYSGNTGSGGGSHVHSMDFFSDTESTLPTYITVVYCKKN